MTRMRYSAVLITTVVALAVSAEKLPAYADGFVKSIVKAPIAADGDVAGAPADFLIVFDKDFEPSVDGYKLNKGQAIRITLPKEMKFTAEDQFPARDLLSAADCKPGLFKCSTGVFLQGWPQHPILPSFPPGKTRQYSMSFDKTNNVLTFTADKDLDGLTFKGPGIKWVHMLLMGFQNPKQPGSYPIEAELLDASGKVTASGSAMFKVRAKIAPSINITSVFVPGDKKGGKPPNPNTIYQKAVVNQPSPMPWDFLVWDAAGKPFVDIKIVQKDDAGGDLMQNGKKIGRFAINAPAGASGQKVSGGHSTAIPSTPVLGKTFGKTIPVGRLTARFTAGSKPGRYSTTFELNDGNNVTMHVDVSAG